MLSGFVPPFVHHSGKSLWKDICYKSHNDSLVSMSSAVSYTRGIGRVARCSSLVRHIFSGFENIRSVFNIPKRFSQVSVFELENEVDISANAASKISMNELCVSFREDHYVLLKLSRKADTKPAFGNQFLATHAEVSGMGEPSRVESLPRLVEEDESSSIKLKCLTLSPSSRSSAPFERHSQDDVIPKGGKELRLLPEKRSEAERRTN